MKSNNFHIDEDQLIIAVVDQDDLPVAVQSHLSECPECLEKKRQLEQELETLGHMAREFAPLPRAKAGHIMSRIRAAVQGKNKGFRSWHPVFATCFVVLFLIVGMWMTSPPIKDSSEQITARLINEMEEDQYFILEIKALEENALPEIYPYISGESYNCYDDEFINYVVPMEETLNNSV
ncbi:MAG: hypothetical protein GY749_10745 [Desulfobacteraceae bacterium]|nr:hypothetical protein [Desulfobacteraceae bacterium]